MVGKYDVYLEYKDSGVSGLGGIPRHWQVMQLKRTVDGCVNGVWGADPTKDGSDTIVLRVADFDRPKLTIKRDGYTIRKIDEKDKLTRKLKPGDLLLEKSGGGAKTLVGQVVLFDGSFEAVTSNFVAKLTPHRGFNSRFLNYVFTRFYSDNINYCSIKQNTGIQNLDSAAYLAEKFGFPFVQEQQKIANFLDHETAKIDTLIEKQQQLIKLLKEKRQAVISHAVTKGLNPNAPMRDSGVEWLGEVPEHWALSSLGYYANISTGATPDRSKSQYWDGDIPWIKTGEVRYDEITEAEEHITPDGVANSAVTLSPPGTLLMAMYGQGVTRGRVALLGIPATYNQACAAITPNGKLWNEYLRHFFMAAYHAIRDGGNETSQMNLNADIVSKFKVTIPDMYEQHKIVEFLDIELQTFDALMDKAVGAIELMQERRTALISAAVTGKIDVRNWQALQPSNKSNNNTGK